MKIKFLIIALYILFTIASQCFAATFNVPFRCYEKELIKEFKKEGINLDKNDIDGDGFIENLASSYKIHTYKRPKDIQLFIDVPRKVFIKMNKLEEKCQ